MKTPITEKESTGAMNPEIAEEIKNLLDEKRKISSRIREINGKVEKLYVKSELPTVSVEGTGHDFVRIPEGKYYIDAPLEKVEQVDHLFASSSSAEVVLKNGEEVGIDSFFTKEEQRSLYETLESALWNRECP